MTFCKELKETTIGDTEILAYEKYEKFSNVPYYEIYIVHHRDSAENYWVETTRTARTTWKRKFQSIVDAYENR